MTRAREALISPITIGAVALLILNDHVLKQHAPGIVTGKLSDLAGMVFFPLLLAAAAELAGVRHHATVVLAALATGIGLAAIKLWDPAGDLYRVGLGALQWPFRALAAHVGGDVVPSLAPVRLTADATDLVVLPALLVPIAMVARDLRGPADDRLVEARR